VPAALVEAGFMSHPTESRRVFDPGYRRQLGRAIADGILAYKRLIER
jgi:N-acetylmuramoyl-L-alanine amidase